MSRDQPTGCREGGAIKHVGWVERNKTRRNRDGFVSLDPSYALMPIKKPKLNDMLGFRHMHRQGSPQNDEK